MKQNTYKIYNRKTTECLSDEELKYVRVNAHGDVQRLVINNKGEDMISWESDTSLIAKWEHTTVYDMISEFYRHFAEKGFFPKYKNENERILHEASQLSLIASEAMEALEGHRCGDLDNMKEELADTAIRIFSFCGFMNIDLSAEIAKKMQINKKRASKHGKRY